MEDGTWTSKAMPIGYGGVGTVDFNPPISGMLNNYTSVFLRREFEVAAGEVPSKLLFRYLLDAWLHRLCERAGGLSDGE